MNTVKTNNKATLKPKLKILKPSNPPKVVPITTTPTPTPSPREDPTAYEQFLQDYNDLIISVAIIILICVIAQLLRIVISRVFAPKSWLRILLNEIVATAELCTTCFELGNVADNYGVACYAVFYFASSVWWAFTWREAYACPNSHLEDFLQNDTDGGTAVVVSATEILTACFIFRLVVKPLWSYNSITIHRDKLRSVCSADLSVRPMYGGAIEGGGTLVFSIVSKIIGLKLESEIFATLLNSMLDTLLVVMAYNYSGGYFNPVLATSMQYGCEGASGLDHFIVYWLGGLLGTVGGLYSFKQLQFAPVKEE